ncbi:hypothetical protein [Pseudocitrobacter cyperus]|uniref:WG repeat-containing protein n=1 Tax=Pseudocitrobacter cyperus TaxID=3112843 RepID=A0ABV0HMA7_9ENTR
MKGFITILAACVLLSGCDGVDKTHEGYYLVADVKVEFDNSHAKPQDNRLLFPEQQRQIAKNIKQVNADNYFNFTPSSVTYYTPINNGTKTIENERVQLNDVDYTITQGKGHTLQLLSDKGTDCGYHACQITLTLKKVSADSPELVKRQQEQKQSESAYQAQMRENIDYFKHLSLDDFLGTPFSLSKSFVIKMPIDMRLVDRTPRDCTRDCNLDALPLASQADGDTLIFTYYSQQERHGGTLYIFNGKPGDITLTQLLKNQTQVLLQTDNGAIYYNSQGKLEAFYYHYDDASQRYFIGIANAATAKQIAREFSVLRTMDPRYLGKKTVSMSYLQLSRQALEEKYQAKVSDVFNQAEVEKAMWKAMDLMLEKPTRFFNPGSSMMIAPIWFPSKKTKENIYVQLYAHSIDTLVDEDKIGLASIDKQKGKREGNVVLYTGKSYVRYNYLIKINEQLTLVLGVPDASGDLREQMFLAQVFKQLDLTKSPLAAIPEQELKNLFKYESQRNDSGRSKDRYFTVAEGLIDNHGNLIIPQPENGRYRFFHPQPPFILSTLEDKEGQDIAWSVFNEQGKLLLQAKSSVDIFEQHLAVTGDGVKKGIFDLNTLQWLLPPTFRSIRLDEGIFIADDADGKYYLVDQKGKTLVHAAKMIYHTAKKNHFAVIGDNGELSMVDGQGQPFFHHRGTSLEYIPPIDAWLIAFSDADGENTQAGIISEQGEMIIPMEYSGYRVTDRYLQMLRSDEKNRAWFDLQQVKEWRNHQPLQEVPAP